MSAASLLNRSLEIDGLFIAPGGSSGGVSAITAGTGLSQTGSTGAVSLTTNLSAGSGISITSGTGTQQVIAATGLPLQNIINCIDYTAGNPSANTAGTATPGAGNTVTLWAGTTTAPVGQAFGVAIPPAGDAYWEPGAVYQISGVVQLESAVADLTTRMNSFARWTTTTPSTTNPVILTGEPVEVLANTFPQSFCITLKAPSNVSQLQLGASCAVGAAVGVAVSGNLQQFAIQKVAAA